MAIAVAIFIYFSKINTLVLQFLMIKCEQTGVYGYSALQSHTLEYIRICNQLYVLTFCTVLTDVRSENKVECCFSITNSFSICTVELNLIRYSIFENSTVSLDLLLLSSSSVDLLNPSHATGPILYVILSGKSLGGFLAIFVILIIIIN